MSVFPLKSDVEPTALQVVEKVVVDGCTVADLLTMLQTLNPDMAVMVRDIDHSKSFDPRRLDVLYIDVSNDPAVLVVDIGELVEDNEWHLSLAEASALSRADDPLNPPRPAPPPKPTDPLNPPTNPPGPKPKDPLNPARAAWMGNH